MAKGMVVCVAVCHTESMKKTLLLLVLGACQGDMAQAGDVIQFSEVCIELAVPACQRAIECGATDTQTTCENDFYRACCASDGTCGREIEIQNDLAPCLDAYGDLSCDELLGGNLPTECLRL